jgi:1,4-dihydroxy-2-naphthoate octaprenyltransferase
MAPPLEHMIRLGRPKFLMYSNVIYTVGVAAAYKSNPSLPFNLWSYIWVCLLVHAIHAMTHYFNEYYDFEADCANKNPSPWTGGSRVLVEGKLKPKVSLMIARSITLIVLSNAAIYYAITGNLPTTVTIILGVIFGHGYSAWPLSTSRRGLGEATVCLVLNILVPLAGYQSHDPSSPFGNRLLWPILLPLLPIQYVRMMVMNMADLEPDKITGKHSCIALYIHLLLSTFSAWPLWKKLKKTSMHQVHS